MELEKAVTLMALIAILIGCGVILHGCRQLLRELHAGKRRLQGYQPIDGEPQGLPPRGPTAIVTPVRWIHMKRVEWRKGGES